MKEAQLFDWAQFFWCTSQTMLIGERLRELRESKRLSQGNIEKRSGLLRCYTSRVENGHTVPSVETLEKYARALEVPMYKLFLDGDEGAEVEAARVNGCAEVGLNEKRAIRAAGIRQSAIALDDRQRNLL
jgi:transcriptional regulator with XRE-family HTH domain